MWIRFGENEKIQVLGAFDEHAYKDGESRQVLRLRLPAVPTSAQLEALCTGPLSIFDDADVLVATYEGFNAVYECNLALGVYGPGEFELLAAQTRAENAERELAATKARADQVAAALAATQVEAALAAAQAQAALAAAQAELEAARAANASLQAMMPDYQYSKINVDPVIEEGGVS